MKSLYRSKLRLIRLLFERGYKRPKVRDLLRFLDWTLRLPVPLENRIVHKTIALEGKKPMPYRSNLERFNIARGFEEGLQQGQKLGKEQGLCEGERHGLLEAIALGLELCFGAQAL